MIQRTCSWSFCLFLVLVTSTKNKIVMVVIMIVFITTAVLSLPPLLPRPFLLAALGASVTKLPLPRQSTAIAMMMILFLFLILVKMLCLLVILSTVLFAVKILRPLWLMAIRMFLPSCFPLRLALFVMTVLFP
jgi:hypothetical protein